MVDILENLWLDTLNASRRVVLLAPLVLPQSNDE